MKHMFLKTTIFVVLFFIPKVVFGNVVINEVFYDPEGVDTGKEYIKLYNSSDSAADLTGWDLDPSSANYFTFPSFILAGKSFVAVHVGASGTNTTTDLYDNGTNNMSNTAGPIAIFNSTSHLKTTIIDYVEYGEGGQTNESKAVDAGIWTASSFVPDTAENKSIKLKTDGADTNSPNDWMESNPTIISEEPASTSEQSTTQQQSSTTNQLPIAEAGDNIIAFVGQGIKFSGTKSIDPDGGELAYSWNMGNGDLIEKPAFDYTYAYPGTYMVGLMVYDGRYYVSDTIIVKIQPAEISISEFMPNPSGKDEEEEWIEIYNASDIVVDVSGWQVDDSAEGSKPFVLPQNTLIAPKGYIVLPRQITGIALNNDADSVRLLLPEGVVFQEINYEKPPQGNSASIAKTGFVWVIPTPGTANISLNINETESKNFVYQQPVATETVKEPSQNYAWRYQNQKQELTAQEPAETIPQNKNQQIKDLAAIRNLNSEKGPVNLIVIIGLIVFFGAAIGMLLVRLRNHRIQAPPFQ